jgi:hypothetical protein
MQQKKLRQQCSKLIWKSAEAFGTVWREVGNLTKRSDTSSSWKFADADAGLSVVHKRKTNDAGLNFLLAFRHSGIHACPLSGYMLHYQSCAVCPCPCCMSMSIMHVHVHVACPCQCCMSMSMSMYIYMEMLEWRTVRHPVSPAPD